MRVFSGVIGTLLLLVGIVPVEARPGQPSAKTLYLLEDDKHEQWCAFREEREWKAEVESVSALVVATATYVDGRLSVLEVTQQDEAGDWIVYDHYSLDQSGRISKLKRTINVLPGDRSEDEVFLMVSGSPKKESAARRKLSTGEPVSGPDVWLPDVPIKTRIEAFPFFPLINSAGTELRSKAKSCAQASQP